MTSVNITSLLPNQPYNVWIRAYTTDTLYSQSAPLKVVTLPDPQKIVLIANTSNSLTISWEPYTRARQYIMKCSPVGYNDSDAEVILDSAYDQQINSANVARSGNNLTVLNLHPKTQYQFWLSFVFENRSDPYNWPLRDDERFVFETSPGRPNPPGKPKIVHVQSNVYRVTWTAAEGNGAMIDEYSLEGLRYHIVNRQSRSTNPSEINNKTLVTNTLLNIPLTVDDPIPIADKWHEYYHGNDTYWIIKDSVASELAQYTFRVRARNQYGWSDYSPFSDRITDKLSFVEHPENLVIAIVAPALVTIAIVSFSCILCGKFQRFQLFH